MDSLNITISDILSQKISDIQSRLPLRMQVARTGMTAQSALAAQSAPVEQTVSTDFASMLTSAGSALTEGTSASLAEAALTSTGSSGSSASSVSSTASRQSVSGLSAARYPMLSDSQLSALMPRMERAVSESAAQYDLDEDLLSAMIENESAWQPFATSQAGAMGLMQLMPGTADDLGVTDPYSIEENIRGGAAYMREQLDAFGGDLALALAAYNAGPNAVRKYNGVPPYDETQRYIQHVMESLETAKSRK